MQSAYKESFKNVISHIQLYDDALKLFPFLLPAAVRPPPSGKARSQSGTDNSGYVRPDMFVCAECDKMYSKQRDLEIHKSYCTGGH